MIGLLAAACSDAAGPPLQSIDRGAVRVEVRLELRDELPTFKVDGVIGLSYRLGEPFGGASDVGTLVLPAGRRTAADSLTLPPLAGRLIARERTFSPDVPFLCGEAGVAAPGAGAILLALDLCHP